MTTTLEHDSALALEVQWVPGRDRMVRPKGGLYLRRPATDGWYVVRLCPCHQGERITGRFETEAEAVAALVALDADARRYAERM